MTEILIKIKSLPFLSSLLVLPMKVWQKNESPPQIDRSQISILSMPFDVHHEFCEDIKFPGPKN